MAKKFLNLGDKLKQSGTQINNWASSPNSRKGGEGRHVVVTARAGTGKSSTLVSGICYGYRKRCPEAWERFQQQFGGKFIPSDQQVQIWNEIELSSDWASRVRFAAFNKSIVTEFEKTYPWLVPALKRAGITFDFSTNHSAGYSAVRRHYESLGIKCELKQYKTSDLFEKVLDLEKTPNTNRESYTLSPRGKALVVNKRGIFDLLQKVKLNLVNIDYDPEEEDEREYAFAMLDSLRERYSVQFCGAWGGNPGEAYGAVKTLYDLSLNCDDGAVDFDDMVWLPCIKSLPLEQYDLILVDEAQDLNACQQSIVKRSGKRLVIVGDDFQAIYGFAAADCDGMNTFRTDLGRVDRGVADYPLTVTRRCPKRVVEVAKQFVPDFEAHPDNIEGIVRTMRYTHAYHPTGEVDDYTGQPEYTAVQLQHDQTYVTMVRNGDMVLARSRAPLVLQYLILVASGLTVRMLGNDACNRIKQVLEGVAGSTQLEMTQGVREWAYSETQKEQAKKFPNMAKIDAILDDHDCCLVLLSYVGRGQGNSQTGGNFRGIVNGVLQRMMGDSTTEQARNAVTLSTVHKAKGLEADKVFVINTKKSPMPSKKAKTSQDMQQERNLMYVAYTRAKRELYHVTDE